jgi:periplasmic copper chaperone A
MRPFRTASLVAVLALIVAACGGGATALSIDDAWGRPSPTSSSNAAFYMTITGGAEDDRIVAAESAACGMVELHETTMTDGSMSMRELPGGIPVPAGETVVLEPGGMHVMCMNVQTPLTVGEAVEIQLTPENSEPITVQAEIRESAPGS